MTTENPWLTGGSDQEPTEAERDPFRSLGFGFTEESPTVEPLAAPLSESSVMATTPFEPVARPGSDLVAMPPAASTELVATSRRALRDAERATPAPRRPRRADSTPRLFPARGPRRASAPETVDRPVAVVSAPIAATPRVPLARRIAKKTFPPIVMLAAASLLVGTSVPANALFDPEAPPASIALSSMPTAAAADTVVLEQQVLEADAAIAETAARMIVAFDDGSRATIRRKNRSNAEEAP